MLPTSIKEIHEIIKDSFKDIIQDVLEVKLDNHLGYEKYQTSESQIRARDILPKLQRGCSVKWI